VEEAIQQRIALTESQASREREAKKNPRQQGSTRSQPKAEDNQTNNNDPLAKLSSAPLRTEKILNPEKPKNQSAINTTIAIPPPDYPLTEQERQLWEDMDLTIFKVVTPIKTDMLNFLT